MVNAQKKRLRAQFFNELGANCETFKALFDEAPLLCFYMKDAEGRIMALNRRNCDVCNIKDEWDAIGLTSREIFPSPYADDYMALDMEVLSTGKPILKRITQYPADRSMNFMISDVYPLRNAKGKIIGTARAYHLSSDNDNDSLRYGQVRKVTQFIEKHYSEDIRLEQLIKLSGMSKNTFIRAFSDIFNMTPWHYLTTIRLNAVRKLLETTDKLLADIAAETGFFDQSHLTRVFKKERGMTPGEYRHRHRSIRGPTTSNKISRP